MYWLHVCGCNTVATFKMWQHTRVGGGGHPDYELVFPQIIPVREDSFSETSGVCWLCQDSSGGSLPPVYSRDTWTIVSHFSGSQHTNCGFVFDIQSVASYLVVFQPWHCYSSVKEKVNHELKKLPCKCGMQVKPKANTISLHRIPWSFLFICKLGNMTEPLFLMATNLCVKSSSQLVCAWLTNKYATLHAI